MIFIRTLLQMNPLSFFLSLSVTHTHTHTHQCFHLNNVRNVRQHSTVAEASTPLRRLSSVTNGNQPASRHDVQLNWGS